MRRSYTFNNISRAILAIMMMASVSVWAQVAKIGETEYATLQDAINAAEADATISLIQDITETVVNTTNANSFSIDLGGHTWTYTQTENDFAALKQDNESSVISLKNGTIVVSGTEGFNVWARNGKVIIESGNYTINSKEDYNIYATTGYVEIYGGTFTNSNTEPYNHNASLKSLNLNVHNTLSTAANIKVYGGTFTADPSKGDDSVWGTSSFVVSGYIVKTHETTPQTTYTVEPKVTVEVNLSGEATSEQTTAANALAGNTSVSETTGLGDNGSLDVSITGVTLSSDNTTVTSATFDVTPKDANGNTITVFSGTYTFRLPISASVNADKWVNLKHNQTYIPASQVKAEGDNKYVEVSTTSFSPFSYNVLENDPVAKIGEQLYETIAAAINDASSTETTIELVANVTEESITISAEKNVKLVGGEYTVSGTITSCGTLTIASGTYTNATENALKTEGNGKITINAGVFSKEPAAGMIAQTSEVMKGAADMYVVAATGTAEAKIVDAESNITLYQTIELAIAAASTTETTITLLKDVAAETINIPDEAKITFNAANGVTIKKQITNAGTLTISDGTYTGTITNNGTLNINGGKFSAKPNSYTCETGKDLVIDETGYYVVVETATVEAKIGDVLYKTIQDAISAAGNTATTITLLKDLEGQDRSITIPDTADITLVIADVVTLSKPISVEGKFAITSGKILESKTITITNFNAKVNITSGVTHPAIALSEALSTDNVLKSKTNDATPTVTSYWVEKKFDAKVDSSITDGAQKTAAETLARNSAISEVTGLAANQSLTITVTSVILDGSSNVTKATFDVKLVGADGVAITTEVSAVTFRLPIRANTPANPWVNLWHGDDPITGTSTIQGEEAARYVSVSSTSFSPFSYEIVENPIAQIGETKYASVDAAITAAASGSPTEATEIKLLGDVSAAITVHAGKNVKLTIGTHTVSGAITNNGTLTIWDGTNTEGTNGVISGNITNTGTLVISENANVSGAVNATGGSLTISGGAISGNITTSGTAALTISGGTIAKADADPALTIIVGGSGTNTISGGTFSAAVTTTANTTISGGTFTNTSTITNNGNTLTITGGIFEFTTNITNTSGTVAISGGTHTNLPGKDLCATGYMPLKNADNTTYGMTNSWTVVDDTDLSINPHLKNGGYNVATAKYERKSGMVAAGSSKTLYGTVCLPFEIKAKPADVKALYKAKDMNADHSVLTITEVTDFSIAIPAGTPLIFELSEAATSMTLTSSDASGVTVNTDAPGTNPVTGNMLVGTYTNKDITGDALTNIYYINGDKFHHAEVKLTVPAFRAYLDVTQAPAGGARPSVLSIVKGDGEVTAITETEAWETVSEVYDLNGRKQSGLQKGVNIMRRADGSSFRVIVK